MSEEKKSRPASVIVELEFPIEWGQELIKTVELKRPKGKHIKNINKDIAMKELLEIASKISGQTPAFFDEMDAVDCLKITEEIGNFLDTGRETGETP